MLWGKSKSRLAHVDGLRAAAVLLVVLFHAAYENAAAITRSHPVAAMLLRQSCHGVDLFFVLSGFCLSYPILLQLRAEGAATFDVVGYAARRLLRILPPYYAAIAIFMALAAVLNALQMPLNGSMSRTALTPMGLMNQLLFLDQQQQFVNASFWTLAIEFRWYFFFPILLLVWIRSPRAFAAIGITLFVLAQTLARNVDFLFLPTFMLGIVAAHLYIYPPRNVVPLLIAPLIALPLAVYVNAHSGWGYYSGPLWGPAMFAFVVAVGRIEPLRRLFTLRGLVAIGFVSYSIYLVHQPVMECIVRYAHALHDPLLRTLVAICVALVLGFAFSSVAERPFLYGGLRRRLLPALESTFRKGLGLTGISTRLSLEAAQARAEASPASLLLIHGVAPAARRDAGTLDS